MTHLDRTSDWQGISTYIVNGCTWDWLGVALHEPRMTQQVFDLQTLFWVSLCITKDWCLILERFRDRQTTNTNTCGWAVFLHVDFRFRDKDIDKTNTNTNTSSAEWNLQWINWGHSAVLYVCRTLRVCRLTAVVYEYTLRLSSRHFFTAVKLIRKVRR